MAIKQIRLSVIKSWCLQILSGLKYIHSLDPPIVHRDIKADNIFINNHNNNIRIGDFGLATQLNQNYCSQFVGTPYYMAPQIFQGKYGPLVDIYAFGMTLLQLVTFKNPFNQCSNVNQICDKLKPQSLLSVNNPQLKSFIQLCLLPQNQRPTAQVLLQHPFMQIHQFDKTIVIKSLLQQKHKTFSTLAIQTSPITFYKLDQGDQLYRAYMGFNSQGDQFNFFIEIQKSVGGKKLQRLLQIIQNMRSEKSRRFSDISFQLAKSLRSGQVLPKKFQQFYNIYLQQLTKNQDQQQMAQRHKRQIKSIIQMQKSQFELKKIIKQGLKTVQASINKQIQIDSIKQQFGSMFKQKVSQKRQSIKQSPQTKINQLVQQLLKYKQKNQSFPVLGDINQKVCIIQKAIKFLNSQQTMKYNGYYGNYTVNALKRTLIKFGKKQQSWQSLYDLINNQIKKNGSKQKNKGKQNDKQKKKSKLWLSDQQAIIQMEKMLTF